MSQTLSKHNYQDASDVCLRQNATLPNMSLFSDANDKCLGVRSSFAIIFTKLHLETGIHMWIANCGNSATCLYWALWLYQDTYPFGSKRIDGVLRNNFRHFSYVICERGTLVGSDEVVVDLVSIRAETNVDYSFSHPLFLKKNEHQNMSLNKAMA